MHEYSVALRISGAKLDPTEVTTRLSLTPTQVRTAGQPRSHKSVWDESMWEYEVRLKGKTDWASLGEGLEAILEVFQSRTEVVRPPPKTLCSSLLVRAPVQLSIRA